MKKSVKSHIYNFLVLASLLFADQVFSDSFEHNSYNNYGIVGLIHTPTARSYDEGVHGITLYDGTPNQTVTLSANPFDWYLKNPNYYLKLKKKDITRILGNKSKW